MPFDVLREHELCMSFTWWQTVVSACAFRSVLGSCALGSLWMEDFASVGILSKAFHTEQVSQRLSSSRVLIL